MKVTIEFEDEKEAMLALESGNWYNAMWKLDQELRGIVKHGYIGNREAHDLEIEAYSKCREMLREVMNDNQLTFDL